MYVYKANAGLVTMYEKEVLGKFPVVQHFRFGSLFPCTWTPSLKRSNRTGRVQQFGYVPAPGR